MPATPMFPLGSVLLPGAILPLHVFEERYRTMVRACLAGDRQFGVVLIARGHEVGGGDARTDVGAMARILDATELPDGRWALVAVGADRIRVVRWLADDPLPQAEVEAWPDPPPGPGHRGLLASTVVSLRRCLALAAEAGDAVPPATFELAEEPVLAGYQASALAPLGPHDRRSLLAAETPEERLVLLADHLQQAAELLRLRLGED